MSIIITGDLTPLIQALDAMFDPFDLTELAVIVREIMIEDNIEARLAGVDADGVGLIEISESTRKRRARRGDGDGPPLVPNGSDSEAIKGFQVDIFDVGEQAKLLLGSWPNAPWMHYHVTGAPGHNMPRRDIVGLQPECMEKIQKAMNEWLATKFTG